jgi:hypothetical protein
MQQRAQYPKRPVRATLVAFAVLSAFVGAFIPFDESIRGAWPFAFGYCALLAGASIGLARLGRRALLLLGVPASVALAPGVVGLALMLRPGGSLDSGAVWLRVSLYCVASVSVRTGGLAPISEVGGVFAPRGPGVPAERIDGVRRVIGGQLVSSAAVSA